MTTCIICYETTNKSTRKESKCPYCSTTLCRTCLQTYLLNEISDTPRCINPECGHGWTREWIDSQATQSFRLQTYKEHREKTLADRERSRLPEVQEQAAMYKLANQTKKETDGQIEQLRTKIRELETELHIQENKRFHAHRTVETFGRVAYPPVRPTGTGQEPAVPKPRVEFIKPCPADECRGFLSTAWKCGLCEQWTCPDCLDLKGLNRDVEHTCDPTKVETARMIQRETRPCPKCGVRISKIEGCDQMWCTACNTGFNWRSGAIATGPIHNPHFFEYLRRTGQQPAAAGAAGAAAGAAQANPIVNCNQINNNIVRILQNGLPYPYYARRARPGDLQQQQLTDEQTTKKWLLELYRVRNEYADHGYNNEPNPDEIYRGLRVKYMAGDFTEEEWKIALQRAEKDVHFYHAKHDLRQLFSQASMDILNSVAAPNPNLEEIKRQATELVTYVNEASAAIQKRFQRKMKRVEIVI